MQAVLDAAQPMVRLLWQRETEGKLFDSPERKAALDKSLRTALMRITDPSIRGHYGAEIKGLLSELYGQTARGPLAPRKEWQPGAPRSGKGGWAAALPVKPTAGTKSSALALDGAEERLLEHVILATCLTHPRLIAAFESDLERADFFDPDAAALRDALLHHASEGDRAVFRAKIEADHRSMVETLFSQGHVISAPPVRNAEDTELARMCLAEGLAKLSARRGARREVEDAALDLGGLADEGLTWRLNQATSALHRAERTNLEDAGDMGEDRAALSKHLQNLIDGKAWIKKKG